MDYVFVKSSKGYKYHKMMPAHSCASHIIVERVAIPNANITMTIRAIIQKRQQG